MPLRDDDLCRFVEDRAMSYDPAAEDYPGLALPGMIRTTRHSAIYAMHSYHQGKKPHDAIRQYIRHFSRPGELVLDPFCGSGGTALAAMLEGRTAIGPGPQSCGCLHRTKLLRGNRSGRGSSVRPRH